MPRVTMTFTLRPLGWIQRLWYGRLGIPAPLTTSRGPGDWVRLLPQSWTWIHRAYANALGFYWAPCVLCDEPYGGHQAGGSIPDPTHPEHSGRSIVICPRCTRAGRSWRVPHPLEAVLDQLEEQHSHGHDEWVTDCVRCLAYDQAIRDTFRKGAP